MASSALRLDLNAPEFSRYSLALNGFGAFAWWPWNGCPSQFVMGFKECQYLTHISFFYNIRYRIHLHTGKAKRMPRLYNESMAFHSRITNRWKNGNTSKRRRPREIIASWEGYGQIFVFILYFWTLMQNGMFWQCFENLCILEILQFLYSSYTFRNEYHQHRKTWCCHSYVYHSHSSTAAQAPEKSQNFKENPFV